MKRNKIKMLDAARNHQIYCGYQIFSNIEVLWLPILIKHLIL